MRCKWIMQEEGKIENRITPHEAINTWIKRINSKLTFDILASNERKYKKKAIDKTLVQDTWAGAWVGCSTSAVLRDSQAEYESHTVAGRLRASNTASYDHCSVAESLKLTAHDDEHHVPSPVLDVLPPSFPASTIPACPLQRDSSQDMQKSDTEKWVDAQRTPLVVTVAVDLKPSIPGYASRVSRFILGRHGSIKSQLVGTILTNTLQPTSQPTWPNVRKAPYACGRIVDSEGLKGARFWYLDYKKARKTAMSRWQSTDLAKMRSPSGRREVEAMRHA
ncbi:hypothetical protein D9611_007416 [Ephemerocybe angulata]|uniref:Uncharacterized protein n=1 Tax=Ephemerocybe angulata TaxID=980116 RepID=A0A8H5CFB3_9AGAR|nr:hypothetical protein D9611_007416 [Tulosesus angulatus]